MEFFHWQLHDIKFWQMFILFKCLMDCPTACSKTENIMVSQPLFSWLESIKPLWVKWSSDGIMEGLFTCLDHNKKYAILPFWHDFLQGVQTSGNELLILMCLWLHCNHTLCTYFNKMYVILLEENLFILRWRTNRQIPSSQSIPVERDVQGSFLPRNRKTDSGELWCWYQQCWLVKEILDENPDFTLESTPLGDELCNENTTPICHLYYMLEKIT